MSEPGPSIFRSLERTAGRDGFDTIVRAAVAAYAPLRRPTQRQAREFGGLVMPLFDRTDRETRRMVAASLAVAPRLPRPLIERLLREPIEVVAPFLLGSPLLTEADIAALHQRGEPALDRLLAARRPTSAKTPEGEPQPDRRPMASGEHDGAYRQTTLLSMGSADGASAGDKPIQPKQPAATETGGAEEAARETLRRMATVGRRPPEPRQESASIEAEDRNSLLGLARRRDSAGLREALARQLLVSPDEAGALMGSDSGKPLAAALKALGVSMADAMTILMMTSPRIGVDVAAFETMQAHYAALDADACAARYNLLSVPSTRTVRHVPQFEASAADGPRRAAAPTFGRRKPLALDLRAKQHGR